MYYLYAATHWLMVSAFITIVFSPLPAGVLARGAIVTPMVWMGLIDADHAESMIFIWKE